MTTIRNNPKDTSIGRRSLCNEIPFELYSPARSKLKRVPVSSGVCVPKGELFEKGDWLVEAGGAHLPAQTEALNHWSDGSIRWLLVRFVAGRISPGKTACTLVRPEKRAQHYCPTTSLRHEKDSLHLSMTDARNATEDRLTLTPVLTSQDGAPIHLEVESVSEKGSGDVCCTFSIHCHARSLPNVSLDIDLEVWPGSGLIEARLVLKNTRKARHQGGLWDLGDEGSFLFRGMHVDVSSDETHDRILWSANRSSQPRTSSRQDEVSITQFGSGSRNWASSNHVDAEGTPTVRTRGYRVDSVCGALRGYRSEPCVTLYGDDSQLSVAIPRFWQEFPKALVAGNDGIRAALFPDSCGPYELQGGEQKSSSAWISVRSTEKLSAQLDWVYQRPRMIQSASWIKMANVMSWLPETIDSDSQPLARYANYVKSATTGKFSLNSRREQIDEYGWRNFGDIPADHEQTNYAGNGTVVSHYNNQFDMIFGGIQNLIVTGDADWYEFFEPLASHVIDIDIYHTQEDRACFNGGLFWHTDHYVDAQTSTHRTYSQKNATADNSYGGGPSNEHNYTTGLLYFYFLTGRRDAFDAVISLADWVIGMDDGSHTIFGILDSGATGLASRTKFDDFHGPGRGVGNSINALLDGWILTGEQKYDDKLRELVFRSVHPNQNCDELQLIDAENRWSYSVCMTALGRVLTERLESGRQDDIYEYVRQTLENYGRWMADNERPTLSQPEQLEFVTEAWPAQDFRKANALRIAASCTPDENAAMRMRHKADELNDAAWHDLHQFGNQHLTARCLSILMTEGLRDLFHRTERAQSFPPITDASAIEGSCPVFEPQKDRVKRLVRNPCKLAVSLRRIINPRCLRNALSAFRKQFG